jgi:hypothetical protein
MSHSGLPGFFPTSFRNINRLCAALPSMGAVCDEMIGLDGLSLFLRRQKASQEET